MTDSTAAPKEQCDLYSDERMESRLAWVRDLAKANLPYPGDTGLDGYNAGWNDAIAFALGALCASPRSETKRTDAPQDSVSARTEGDQSSPPNQPAGASARCEGKRDA